jgi:cyclopropane fatty-acyl-phospholipid synthase-like methyltransferase
MKAEQVFKKDSYFKARNIEMASYSEYRMPLHIINNLPASKEAVILDIGCGLGQMLNQLKLKGYNNLLGVDISNESIEACVKLGINVELIDDVISYSKNTKTKFDFIVMSHVLEHIEKEKIIDTLKAIKENLLISGGVFLLMVPNAQSNTGCYWMYEDFTHHTLFTAGSLSYVLLASGFEEIEFVDPYCVSESSRIGKVIKMGLIKLYEMKNNFWNKVTSSSYHNPSPKIYSFELKVKAF